MKHRSSLFFGLILGLAGVLTFFKVPVASSQGTTLTASYVKGDLPVSDPASDLWQKASSLDVPVSAQTITRPILPETSVRSLTARALHNGSQIAILVEWQDATENDRILTVQDFRDAVAVQFPLGDGQPFFCMGQQGGNVNIWHWKSDWQTDITAQRQLEVAYPNMHVDQYPFAQGDAPAPSDYTDPNYLPAYAAGNLFAAPHVSSVEDLIAGGFGSLTSQPANGQNVQGFGVWENGHWQVIFSRDLVSKEADDASFAPDKVYSMAFAVWDGANGERNGQKSTSQWVSMQLGSPEEAPAVSQQQSAKSSMAAEVLLVLVAPMVLIFLLALGFAGTMLLLTRLPEKKR